MGDIKNLSNEEAVKKMQELVKAASVCMFTTSLGQKPLTTRPMDTQEVDNQGNFWFLSRRDSEKNHEVMLNDRVQLIYSNHGSAEYMSVYGHAKILTDRQKIEQLWTPIAKTWFTEGKDDPEITLIRVTPIEAYYWDTKGNKMIALVKMVIGAITGKDMREGVEGKIDIR